MAKLAGGSDLAEINKANPKLGALLQRIIQGVNTTAKHAGVSSVGETTAPQAPHAVSVKQSGELLHIAIGHGGAVERGVRYFSEIAKTPDFAQPLVIDHGSSRTSHPISLPTNDASGTPHQFFLRSYAQYPGSPPSDKIVYGGASSPTAITMTGSTNMDLVPSTGSGTAAANGSQGGYGLGKFPQRMK